MSSVVPTVAVAGVLANRTRAAARRASSSGRRLVLVHSGKRAGRTSKFSLESLIVSANAKKRDKAYGYGYGYGYGWNYGHEYGDPEWGHVTGEMAIPSKSFDVSTAKKRVEDVVSPSRQVEVVSAPTVEKKNAEPTTPTVKEPTTPTVKEPPTPTVKEPPTPTVKEPPTPTVKEPLVPSASPRALAGLKKTPTPREIANRLNELDARSRVSKLHRSAD